MRKELPQTASVVQTILSQDSGLGDGWSLRIWPHGRDVEFAYQSAITPFGAGPYGPASNRWQPFAVRATPREVELWLNGVRAMVVSTNGPQSGDSGPLCAGNSYLGNTPWEGDLRDLRMYDRALTDVELQSLAAAARSEPVQRSAQATVVAVRSVTPYIGHLSEYRIQQFTTDHGLPSSEIQCLLQSRNGALWLGSEEGLTRFDGRNFTIIDGTAPEFAITGPDVGTMAEDGGETRWLGMFHGLVRQRGQEWRSFTNIGPSRFIRTVTPAIDGTVWLAGFRDMNPRGPSQLRRFDPTANRLQVDTPVSGQVRALHPTTDGVWIATDEPAALWHFEEASGGVDLVVQLAAVDQGIHRPIPLVRVTSDVGARSVNAEVWAEAEGSLHWAQVHLGAGGPTWTWTRGTNTDWAMLEAQGDGSVSDWVATERGLLRRDGNRWERLTLSGAYAGIKVVRLAANAEGGVWAATEGEGLWLVQPHPVKMLRSDEGWGTEKVASLQCLRDGRLLVGGWLGGQARIDPQAIIPAEISRWRTGGMLAAEALDGTTLRILTRPGMIGFYRESGTNQWRHTLGTELGASGAQSLREVSQFHVANNGAVWIVSENGVICLPQLPQPPVGNPTAIVDRSAYVQFLNTLPETVSLCGLAEAPDGAIWVGSFGAGLFRIFQGKIENFPEPERLIDNPCVPVGFSSDGTLWLGSEAGLGIWRDGQYRWVRPGDGLPESVVSDVEEAEGYVWFAGRRGVHAIRRDELEEFFAGKRSQVSALSLGRSDGLASTETQLKSQPAMAQTDDGQIWIATAQGLAHFHPREVLDHLRPPPVAVDGLTVNEQSFTLRSGPITLPPGGGRVVEIAFSSLSFVAPERVTFEYRLTGPGGLDDTVSKSTTQPYAVFTHLRPGRHAFKVTARSGNGLVSDPPARLEFTIEPHFYQTPPFYLVIGLVAILSVAGLVVVRVRVAERRAARKQERRLVAERTRIAQDMHDNLGSGLARLAWKNGHPDAATAEDSGNHSQNMARELLRSLDEVVWATNPTQDHLEGVVNYLGFWVRDYFTDTPLTLALDLPPSVPDRPVTAQWRHHVLMMVREICANALKHARASRIDISVRLEADPGMLSIRLQDDGIGIPLAPDDLSPRPGSTDPRGKLGGHGIRNLRERATALHARLRIVSQPGSGTEITIAIPLPPQ